MYTNSFRGLEAVTGSEMNKYKYKNTKTKGERGGQTPQQNTKSNKYKNTKKQKDKPPNGNSLYSPQLHLALSWDAIRKCVSYCNQYTVQCCTCE